MNKIRGILCWKFGVSVRWKRSEHSYRSWGSSILVRVPIVGDISCERRGASIPGRASTRRRVPDYVLMQRYNIIYRPHFSSLLAHHRYLSPADTPDSYFALFSASLKHFLILASGNGSHSYYLRELSGSLR